MLVALFASTSMNGKPATHATSTKGSSHMQEYFS